MGADDKGVKMAIPGTVMGQEIAHLIEEAIARGHSDPSEIGKYVAKNMPIEVMLSMLSTGDGVVNHLFGKDGDAKRR